jgi:iron(III) transport system substrate-binding protein
MYRVGNLLAVCLLLATLPACKKDGADKPANATSGEAAKAPAGPVVIYTSVDEEFARQVLDAYRAKTGAELSVVYDSEAGKTTGLVRRLEMEVDRPRCDVFWSGELFNTILLARAGVLDSYDSPAAADIPAAYRDPQHRWTATGLRGRVLAFDPQRGKDHPAPTTWEQLADPAYAPDLAFANPLFGTTRGHIAAMYALWGPQRGRAWLIGLRDGRARMLDGNSAAVRAVAAGQAQWCATDTDDVWVAQRAGESLELRYLDMGDGGTLLIPCSVAVVKGAPNPAGARHLADYLVSPEVERMLAESASRNIPVRESLRKELGLELPPCSKVSYDAIADAMDEAVAAAREILLQ